MANNGLVEGRAREGTHTHSSEEGKEDMPTAASNKGRSTYPQQRVVLVDKPQGAHAVHHHRLFLDHPALLVRLAFLQHLRFWCAVTINICMHVHTQLDVYAHTLQFFLDLLRPPFLLILLSLEDGIHVVLVSCALNPPVHITTTHPLALCQLAAPLLVCHLRHSAFVLCTQCGLT